MEEKKNPSFRGILVEFMGYTTGHGFGRLVAATTFVWRIFWTLAILGASGMFAMEVMNLFKLYLSRPVQTSVTVTFEKVYYYTEYSVEALGHTAFGHQIFRHRCLIKTNRC